MRSAVVRRPTLVCESLTCSTSAETFQRNARCTALTVYWSNRKINTCSYNVGVIVTARAPTSISQTTTNGDHRPSVFDGSKPSPGGSIQAAPLPPLLPPPGLLAKVSVTVGLASPLHSTASTKPWLIRSTLTLPQASTAWPCCMDSSIWLLILQYSINTDVTSSQLYLISYVWLSCRPQKLVQPKPTCLFPKSLSYHSWEVSSLPLEGLWPSLLALLALVLPAATQDC